MQSSSSPSDRPRTQTGTPAADARKRLAERIQFADNAAWVKESPLARAFTEALCDTLAQEDVERIRVRCGVARDDASDGLRFMCKVEYAGDGAAYPWSWWSPLMERPEELIGELRRALKGRRERTMARPLLENVGADKARGPAHDTWSTAPWDLGNGIRPDSFCRNRRGRWAGHSAAPKPFRPRSPR